MNTKTKVLHLQPARIDRQSEHLLQTVFGTRGVFDSEAPDLNAVVLPAVPDQRGQELR